MGLIKSNTKWILFLSCSAAEVEQRHFFDLIFGAYCLKRAGINEKDIFVYIDDSKNRDSIANFFKSFTGINYTIHKTDDFFEHNNSNEHENLVMFVSGHGSHMGIDKTPPITPENLLTSLKKTPKLKQCIVYLGQCFAGTFNYTKAGKSKGSSVDVILIGATGLTESISTATTETFINNQKFSWVANLFLLYLFKWFAQPVDIDGDNKFTILDSYKYAGIFSTNLNRDVKINGFVSAVELHFQLRELIQEKNATPDVKNPQLDLKIKATSEKLKHVLELNHLHQECWILNVYPAQEIDI